MKIIHICNNAPLYRQGIFKLMDATFDCDWVFGEALGDIKQFDVKQLQGKVTVVKNVPLMGGRAYWQKGVVSQLFKGYTHHILLGEERCISTWVFIILACFCPKKKVFFWTHGPYGKEGWLKRMIQYVFYRLVDGGFVYGNYSRDILIKRGLSADKYVTIHNSLDYDRQIEIRNKGLKSDVYAKHFEKSNPVLLFIGRLTKVKKLDMLVNAVSKLKEKCEDYNLVFVGDGTERDALTKLADRNGIQDRVWFYGACYDEKTNAELIYNADMCVAPGNVGLTAMHSMVFGTPVISHNNYPWQMPEFEAIRPGRTGDFFEYENLESLCDCISRWFKENHNREDVRKACYEEIDTQWNPQFQIEVLKQYLK